jgi:hypothetical protein
MPGMSDIALIKDGKLVRMVKSQTEAAAAFLSGEADAVHPVSSIDDLNRVLGQQSAVSEVPPPGPADPTRPVDELLGLFSSAADSVMTDLKKHGGEAMDKGLELVQQAKTEGVRVLKNVVRNAIHNATKPK